MLTAPVEQGFKCMCRLTVKEQEMDLMPRKPDNSHYLVRGTIHFLPG